MVAEYEENNCKVILMGGQPFLVLNFEEYADLKGMHLPHCDVVYVMHKDNKWNVYLVELKNIADKSASLDAIRSLRDKFERTKRLLGGLLDCLGARHREYYHILVVPRKICVALAKHTLLLKRKRILGSHAWIVPCGDSIFGRCL